MKTYTQHVEVTHEMTAARVGSGLLDVYATPMVAALMENTACMLLDELEGDERISDEETTVGTHIDIQHIKASPVGEQVACKAILTAHEGRRYVFTIEVMNARNEVLATATHERVRVNRERFMNKVAEQVKR